MKANPPPRIGRMTKLDISIHIICYTGSIVSLFLHNNGHSSDCCWSHNADKNHFCYQYQEVNGSG